MTKLWPNLVGMARLVQPETILRWHRMGFGVFWRWKSRNRAGRPKIDRGLRDLIRRISSENPLWGASRIHGELLMLGFEVAQSTVSKYMVRGRNPPSQSWKTFLRNHGEAIAAVDMCVVPTVNFELLFAFLVLGDGRRHLHRPTWHSMRDSSECQPHQCTVDEKLRVPLALFRHGEDVLSKRRAGAVGAAIQVIALYPLPSSIQCFTEDMTCLRVKVLCISNISHFTF